MMKNKTSDIKRKFIILYFGKEFGGGGVYVRRLCESLSAEGVEHEFYTYFTEFRVLKNLNMCNVHIFRGYFLALFKTFINILFHTRRSALVLIPTDHISVRFASFIHILFPFSKIIYILQCSLDLKKDKVREIVRTLFYLPISVIAGNSNATVNSIGSYIKRHKHTGVIYYGLDPKEKKNFTQPPNTSTVVLPGRVVSGKGHKDLLLASEGQGWNILFAGDGSDMIPLQKKCKNRPDVTFLGWVEDMSSIYLKSSVVVLPSISEGFGLVLLEAMSMGRPVISYNVGATAELIKHEETGLLVNNGDINELRMAIQRVLNDTDFAQKISYNAYKFAWSHFTKSAMAHQFMKLVNLTNKNKVIDIKH